MSIETIKAEVRGLLAQANLKFRDAERLVAGGTDRERVDAAGQLVFLKRHKHELEARMRELDNVPEGVASTVFQWFKEDWVILLQRLEMWMESR
jgi:hypothetical protein